MRLAIRPVVVANCRHETVDYGSPSPTPQVKSTILTFVPNKAHNMSTESGTSSRPLQANTVTWRSMRRTSALKSVRGGCKSSLCYQILKPDSSVRRKKSRHKTSQSAGMERPHCYL